MQGMKYRWKDSVRRCLEEQIGDFVVALEAIGHVECQRAAELEARRRQEMEE